MELTLLGIADDSVQKKLRKRFPLANNLHLYFSLYSSFEIPKGQIFSKAIIEGHILDINATLAFITQSQFIELDFIGTGWQNIVGLSFNGNIPKGLLHMEKLNSWYDKKKRSHPVTLHES